MTAAPTIEVVCRICGQPLKLSAPGLEMADEQVRHVLMRHAGNVVHNDCDRLFRDAQKEKERIRLIELRTQTWGAICPPLYQNTDPKRLAINQKAPHKFESAMAWGYGPKGLGLFGTSGGGKTRTVYLLLHREHLAGRSVVAITHTEFTGQANRLAFSNDKTEQLRWIRTLKTADVLFIDDLGKSRFTTADGGAKAGEETLWDVCESRWQNLLPFLFTCNLPNGGALADAMSDDKGKAFLRRLREFCTIVPF